MSEYVVDFGDKSSAFVGLAMAEAESHGATLKERIVRCRDCRHATPDTSGRKRYKGYLWCDTLTEGIGFSVAPSDFCAWGETEEGEI
jgi:hypothetical protein